MSKIYKISKEYIYFAHNDQYYLINLKNFSTHKMGKGLTSVLALCDGEKDSEQICKNNSDFKEALNLLEKKKIISEVQQVEQKKYHKVYVNVTRKCNLKCPFCFVDKSKKDILDESAIESALNSIIDECDKECEICISGGEPIAYKNIENLIEYCRRNFCKVNILTNGTLIDDSNYLMFAEVDSVGVSIDAASENGHDRSRGVKGAFAKTIYAISKLNEVTSVVIQSTVSPNSIDHMMDIADLAYKLNVSGVRYSILHNIGEADSEAIFKKEDYCKYLDMLSEIKKKFPTMKINGSLNKNSLSSEVGCGADRSVLIDSIGVVSICPGFVGDSEYQISLEKINKIREIEPFKNFYENPLRNEKGCNICSIKNLCGGSCVADNNSCEELKAGIEAWIKSKIFIESYIN